jgi:glucokinase
MAGTAEWVLTTLDFGGTQLKGAVVNENGKVHAGLRRQTPSGDGADAVLIGLLDALNALRGHVPTDATPTAVGMTATGIVDERAGLAIDSANVGWRNTPLRSLVRSAVGLPRAAERSVGRAVTCGNGVAWSACVCDGWGPWD